ncbi:MAG TPA: glycosyltransferase [Pyrinomonadaceae bacterium]|jgi:glycosyltransferase involved in cell wall biosynthesis
MTTPHAKTLRTLYLCYFGLREPLVQTQVLPYLRELHRGGVEVHLLTFEPNRRTAWSIGDEREWRERLAREGIRWHALAYHKSPSVLVTPYDIVRGAMRAARLARKHAIDVLHARGHLPMAMALLARRIYGRVRLLFDIRGLLAEEYEEAGVWTKDSPQYRAIQAVERAGLKRSAQLIVLTRRLRDLLVERGLARAEQIEVVPCCVDFARFDEVTRNGDGAGRASGAQMDHDAARASLEKSDEQEAVRLLDEDGMRAADEEAGRFEVVTAGSVTGLYLLEEMGRFFLALKRHRPDAFLRVLTTSNAADATATLERTGLARADFWVGAARPSEVPAFLRRARLGLSFRKATFSQIAASPTKIPEYLAAGLPAVCNAGIGDTDDILTRERVGVIVRDFTEETLDEAARAALALASEQGVGERAVETAHRYFDLARVGGVGYRNAYRRLAADGVGAHLVRETM